MSNEVCHNTTHLDVGKEVNYDIVNLATCLVTTCEVGEEVPRITGGLAARLATTCEVKLKDY